MVVSVMKMAHTVDPRLEIANKIGDTDGMEIFFNQVLIAIYMRPEKTAGGIILTDKARTEDKFQGKVGLVVKVGPHAYVDDEVTKFHGQKVSVGDWVLFNPSDGWAMDIGEQPCRILEDTHVKGRIPSPDAVY